MIFNEDINLAHNDFISDMNWKILKEREKRLKEINMQKGLEAQLHKDIENEFNKLENVLLK